jgi:hypothetical protein
VSVRFRGGFVKKRKKTYGLGNRDDGGNNSGILASSQWAISDGRCARRDSDNCRRVHSGSGVRTTVASNSAGGDAGHRARGTDCLNDGACENAGLHSRAAFGLDGLGLGDGCRHGHDDRSRSSGSAVVLKTESSINTLGEDELESAVVGALAGGLVEGSGNTGLLGGADINTVAKTGGDYGNLTLSGLNGQRSTDDTGVALDGECDVEAVGDDASVQLGADQALKTSRGSDCRGTGAGGSRVGVSRRRRAGTVVRANDSGECDSRSSLAGVLVDCAEERASLGVGVECGANTLGACCASGKAVIKGLASSLGEDDVQVKVDTLVGDVNLQAEGNAIEGDERRGSGGACGRSS